MSPGLTVERAERQRVTAKARQENRELKSSIDTLRMQLHDERTSWAMDKADLQKTIDDLETRATTGITCLPI